MVADLLYADARAIIATLLLLGLLPLVPGSTRSDLTPASTSLPAGNLPATTLSFNARSLSSDYSSGGDLASVGIVTTTTLIGAVIGAGVGGLVIGAVVAFFVTRKVMRSKSAPVAPSA
jgi:hypothetical protein